MSTHATGITASSPLRSELRRRDLENAGTLEHAQRDREIAAECDPPADEVWRREIRR